MAKYGMMIYALGICLTVIAAAKLPADGLTWPDTVFLFNDGLILTILGLALWRLALRETNEEVLESDKDPLKLLRDTKSIVDELYRAADDLETYQFQDYIKILQDQYLLPITLSRQSLVNKFGMKRSAELLITISYAERILNRVYSAASDQHLEEAVRCTEEAHEVFQEAYRLAQKLS
jgi:hypothetical protein